MFTFYGNSEAQQAIRFLDKISSEARQSRSDAALRPGSSRREQCRCATGRNLRVLALAPARWRVVSNLIALAPHRG